MDEEMHANAGGYAERLVRNESFMLPSIDWPDARAVSNARKAQVLEAAREELGRARSYVLATLVDVTDDDRDVADFGDDAEYAFTIQFAGSLEGTKRETSELLWQMFNHMIEQTADVFEVPPAIAFAMLMRRWADEHRE